MTQQLEPANTSGLSVPTSSPEPLPIVSRASAVLAGPLAHCAMTGVAFVVGFMVYLVGAHDVTNLRNLDRAGSFVLTDAAVTADEIRAVANASVGDPCGQATKEYEAIRSKLTIKALKSPIVTIESPSSGQMCLVLDERVSAWAGVEVLASSLLSALSTLLILPAVWLVRLLGQPRVVLRRIALPLFLTIASVGGLSVSLAGAARWQPHILLTDLFGIAAFALPAAVLISVLRSCTSAYESAEGNTLTAEIDLHRQRAAAARLATVVLSLLLSLTVFDVYAIFRRIAVWNGGTAELDVQGTFLGGIVGRSADVVVAVEGSFFVLVMLAVAGPALLAIETAGNALAARLRAIGFSNQLADIDPILRHEQATQQLGLSSSLYQNTQSLVAIGGPLIMSLITSLVGQ
jgi:hypothetical protein